MTNSEHGIFVEGLAQGTTTTNGDAGNTEEAGDETDNWNNALHYKNICCS